MIPLAGSILGGRIWVTTTYMAESTQGNFPCKISDGEITPTPASKILEMTKAFPDDTNVSAPRCYDECIVVKPDEYKPEMDDEQVSGGDDPLYCT